MTTMTPIMTRMGLLGAELRCVLEEDMEQYVMMTGTIRMHPSFALSLDSLPMVRLSSLCLGIVVPWPLSIEIFILSLI